MLLLFRNRGGGGLPLPPDYNPATDDLWIAQPGSLYSDAAGTALLTGAGNALSWRSLRGTLATVTAAVPWDGIDTLVHNGTQLWTMTSAPRSIETLTVVARNAPNNAQVTSAATGLYYWIAAGFDGNRWRASAANTPALQIVGESTSVWSVLMAVFNGVSSALRVNGSEVTGNTGIIAGQTGIVLAGRPGNPFACEIRALWTAPGRAFDAAQRASNESAMAALCQVVLP